MSKKIKVLILAIILTVISILFIILNGNTYTIKTERLNDISNIENLNIKMEEENIIERKNIFL